MAKRTKPKKAIGRESKVEASGSCADVSQDSYWLSREWLSGLILLLAVIVAYSPVYWAGYVWDDDIVLTANPCIVGPLGLKEIWTTNATDIAPVTRTTFWLEHALWGLTPRPYHLVNVLIHGGCAVLLWRILRILQVPGAWLGAALWALHPVQVESVAWIAEMKNTESGFFYLLTIFFFVRWLKANPPKSPNNGNGAYGFTLVFSALAIASKASTVVLPGVLCLCAWWVEGRWRWRNLARVSPILLMAIADSALSMAGQRVQFAQLDIARDLPSWPVRLCTAGDAVWFYLGKVLWPHPLIAMYPKWNINVDEWVSYLPALIVILVLFILWLNRGTWARPGFFTFAYFVTALIPVLGIAYNTIFAFSPVFDHLQYLASMGPLALIAAGMTSLAAFVIPGRSWLQSTLGAGLLAILGLLSWQRSWAYESAVTLWTDAVAGNPNNWEPYYYLSNALLQDGKYDEAIAPCQKAVEMNPGFAGTHYNLGDAFFGKKQFDEAIIQYQEVLKLESTNPEYYFNLGIALRERGKIDEAIMQDRKAVKLDPNLADVHFKLGFALSQKGRLDDAMEQYQKALEINPRLADVHYNLGEMLNQKDQLEKAITEYRTALEINPNLPEAHNGLGIALFRKGQTKEAIAKFQEALRLKPDYTPAKNNLAKMQSVVDPAPPPPAK